MHKQSPPVQVEFEPQVPPTQPLQVGVPHTWQGTGGVPPMQFRLQSKVPPHSCAVSQVWP